MGWDSFFWRAFEGAANPMVVLESERRAIVAINHASSRMFGYGALEVLGKPSDQLVSSSWPKLREAHWAKLLNTGAVHGQREVMHKDGGTVRVRFEAHSETVGGRQLILWVAFGRQLKLASERTPASLTARELEVVAGLAAGKRVHEIAEQLMISPATAQTHVRNAMTKLAARSQAQLVTIALATGLLDLESVTPRT